MQIVGVDHTRSHKPDEVDQMLLRHLIKIRQCSVYSRSAIVLIIEANLSWIVAEGVAKLLSRVEFQPVVVLSEDSTPRHRAGVWTGEYEKVVYIDTLRQYMNTGHVHWAKEDEFISDRPVAVREELCKQMMAYRRERKEPAQEGWNQAKTKIFGKAHGLQDDLMMALQMSLYWGLTKLGDPDFAALRNARGWN